MPASARARAAVAAVRRQLEVKVVAPQAERADQPLALAAARWRAVAELRGDLGVEDLVARLVELVHRAGLAEALRQLGRGLARSRAPARA